MSYKAEIRIKDRHRRERKIWRNGIAMSVAVHFLVFFIWKITAIPVSPYMTSGPEQSDRTIDKSSLRALSIWVAPNLPIAPSPIPIPSQIDVQEVKLAQIIDRDPVSVLGEWPGPDKLPGLSDGLGMPHQGVSGWMPATPRDIIIPNNKRDLSGREIQVWVFIDESGGVIPDSTYISPATEDIDFNRRLIRQAAEWLFRPATRDGNPVVSWFTYRISI
ncbi:MAG: hypothetical protein CME14_08585 [Gemmatimonadetes bacterium]|nr:hypothetical protein [Gemmatimonadota bacterium]|tara:strand:- start:153 stop:806 length:654 start_codon:yes stop_codon:yes gene_type:complete